MGWPQWEGKKKGVKEKKKKKKKECESPSHLLWLLWSLYNLLARKRRISLRVFAESTPVQFGDAAPPSCKHREKKADKKSCDPQPCMSLSSVIHLLLLTYICPLAFVLGVVA